jgi:RNA polymerase-binding transcription factor DksA
MAHDTSPNFGTASDSPLDLDDIDVKLDAVEVALVRLENGTYFTDEITGKPLDEQLLTNNPIARRA